MRKTPLLALVGGFLGAGKTTLLIQASRLLAERGLKAAIITNDQAAGLVDTALAARTAAWTGEVAGGCFCCSFDALVSVADELAGHNPDIIFAEPVGSCTDLVATVLKPLADLHAAEYRLAPFSVLVDPSQVDSILNGDPNVAYLYRKQMEEADLVCFTKSDLEISPPSLPVSKPFRFLSGKSGEGVGAWLDEISNGRMSIGSTSLELDYSLYARAEAAMGWLNASLEFQLERQAPPIAIVGPLMDEIDRALTDGSSKIAHLKLLDETPFGFLKASICRNGAEPEIEGDLLAPATVRHSITLNLRAQTSPEILKNVVTAALASMPPAVKISTLSAFSPAAPQPQHRYV